MNVIRGQREHPEEGERADGGGGTLSRRGILGGLAALPVVLYGVGSATPALATTASVATTATRPGSGLTATGDLVRGAERRYNAPLLTPGTRLVLRRTSRPCLSRTTTIARTSRGPSPHGRP